MMRNNDGSRSSLNPADCAAASSGTTTMLKKGPWSAAEDAILIDYVQKHGEGNWNSVQKNCGLARCGKSCRLRWANHLRPNLKKGSFTPEEEMLILQLHSQMGNKWARMAAQMPGRTDNEIKNYWNTRIKRRQRAGLPLYHPMSRMSQARPPPLLVPSLPSSPMQLSPLPLFTRSPIASPSPMSESPRIKRMGEQEMGFQFPAVVSVVNPYINPSSTMSMNMFQYNYGNYNGYGEMNAYTANSMVELPSSQVYNGGGGGESGCGIMDALLQDNLQGDGNELQRRLVFSDNPIGGGGGGNGDEKGFFENSRCADGISMKIEQVENQNPTSTTQDDISKLFNMISTPLVMPAGSDWQAGTVENSSCDISNGGQSSVATDDELGLELHHLASSLSGPTPAEQEWNIGSCPWNNMPGIS